MGISRREPQHLLDTPDEQNIGNSVYLQPELGPYPSGTCIPATNPQRLLNLNGPSSKGQTTTVVFTASRVLQGTNNPNPGFAGPITGVVEFGSGGRFTRVEVDVPIGPYVGIFQGASSAIEPQDGGAIVTVPTSVLRAYCRYDNLLVASSLGPTPYTVAERAGVPLVGPGGPHSDTDSNGSPIIVGPEPVLVRAMTAYYSRHFSKSYKTQYVYVGDPSVAPISLAGGYANLCVPAHAKSIKVLRYPNTAVLTLQLFDGINRLQTYDIAAGAYPTFAIDGNVSVAQVISKTIGASDKITFLALVYEIGV
jgi:hypothetical protein